MLAASAAFRSSPNATAAADVVGAMLARWHYIALAAPLALFAIELRDARRFVLVVLFAALLLAAAQVFVDLRIRAIRTSSPVPISSLERGHPERKRFGALHGASMALLLLQTIAAAAVVAAKERPVADFKVVMNEEEQYSIWPGDRQVPAGWKEAGFTGPKEQCLDWIKERWTDMRPKSLRDAADQDTSGGGP